MAESLDALVERARAALAGAPVAATPAGDDAPDYRGESPDGRARASVLGDGHVQTLELDPDLLREPLAEVAAAVAAAINAALAARPGRADLSSLVGVLTQVREQARRELAIVTTGFADVEAGVRAVRSAQRSADGAA